MGYGLFATNVMTRRGQSSRWAYRSIVKAYTRRRRRAEAKRVVARARTEAGK